MTGTLQPLSAGSRAYLQIGGVGMSDWHTRRHALEAITSPNIA